MNTFLSTVGGVSCRGSPSAKSPVRNKATNVSKLCVWDKILIVVSIKLYAFFLIISLLLNIMKKCDYSMEFTPKTKVTYPSKTYHILSFNNQLYLSYSKYFLSSL